MSLIPFPNLNMRFTTHIQVHKAYQLTHIPKLNFYSPQDHIKLLSLLVMEGLKFDELSNRGLSISCTTSSLLHDSKRKTMNSGFSTYMIHYNTMKI